MMEVSDRERERLEASRNAGIQFRDPFRNGPKNDRLQRLHRDMNADIRQAVATVFDLQYRTADIEEQPVDFRSQPRLFEVLKAKDELWDLVRDMFGLSTQRDLIEKVGTTHIRLEDFLEGLISNGIDAYIFHEQEINISELMNDRTSISARFERLVAEGISSSLKLQMFRMITYRSI